ARIILPMELLPPIIVLTSYILVVMLTRFKSSALSGIFMTPRGGRYVPIILSPVKTMLAEAKMAQQKMSLQIIAKGGRSRRMTMGFAGVRQRAVVIPYGWAMQARVLSAWGGLRKMMMMPVLSRVVAVV
ncbi:MAG: hypothetical protein K8953_06600, partial [Proteobacteria bacterium]|nr:hypothetical protein [Pseudomonadota bacterium]